MSFRIKLWGVRGSLPTPKTPSEINNKITLALHEFVRQGLKSESDIPHFMNKLPVHLGGGYGGHTTCIEAKYGDQSLIIDGGSGIQRKAIELMKGPCAIGEGEVHILLSHFHWDHIIGLPFFIPLFIPGNKIHFYAVQDEMPDVFNQLFSKPYFPVPSDQLSAHIQFHKLEPRTKTNINGFDVTPYLLDHPDPCWGFRVEKDGAAYSHCVDTECTRVTPAQLDKDLPLYQNVDLMVFDAQYTIKEASEKVNWGHAAASFGIDIGMRENIKKILFVHHDPASSDEKIKSVEMEMRKYHEKLTGQLESNGLSFYPIRWDFAREDEEIEVKG